MEPEVSSDRQHLRDQAAKKISELRTLERNSWNLLPSETYNRERTEEEYEYSFHGVRKLIEYAKTFIYPVVVGLGEGEATGFRQIAKKNRRGLTYLATVLTAPSERNKVELKKIIGEKNVRITSAEVMRGFEPSSVAVVIANFSLAYADPVLSITRLDEILEPGGAIKATFSIKEGGGRGLQTAEQFIHEWLKLGYDCSTITIPKEEWTKTYHSLGPRTIVLAIKPGKEGPPSNELLSEDQYDLFHPSKLKVILESIDRAFSGL